MLPFMSRSKAFVGRLALCVFGVFSILVGRTYGTLRLFYSSDRWVWTVFSVTLVGVGIISVVAGLLPDSRAMEGVGTAPRPRVSAPIARQAAEVVQS